MKVGVIGPLEIDGRPATLGPRDRVVLSALVLERGSVCPANVLAEALWGETPPSTWSKVVQGAVVRLRRALGREAIETTGGGYVLRVPAQHLDAAAFETVLADARSLSAAGDAARALVAYADALDLWRGTAYAELLDWPPGRSESLRLEELRQAAEEDRLDAGITCGRAAELVPSARTLVEAEPYRERRWSLLAVALYETGRQAEAVDVLRRASATLRSELGLDPGPALRELQRAVLTQELPPRRAAALPVSEQCPYPGLLPFDEADADRFAGRESDVAACLGRLEEHALLVVTGPSGSGKSSLVRAGLVPALRSSGRRVVLLAPGPDVRGRLAAQRDSAPAGTVLVVDQVEEITASRQPAAARAAFLDDVGAWGATGPVVLVVRTDRLDDLAGSPALAGRVDRGTYRLTAMSDADLRRAVERPARRAGLLLESSLLDVLLRDLGQDAGALPLLSHALRATWERRERDVLTVAAYTAAGGIGGAVTKTAEDVCSDLDQQELSALRGLLRRLVVLPPGGPAVSVRLSRGLLSQRPDVLALLDRLVAARLLTADGDSLALAHASLVTAWPRLRQWIEDDAEGQTLSSHLQLSAEGWVAAARPDSDLYRGHRLRRTLGWRDRTRPVLGPDELEFLESSAALEAAQAEGASRAAARTPPRRRRVLVVAAVAVAVLVGGVAAATALLPGRPVGADLARAMTAGEAWLLLSHRDSTGLTNTFVVRPDGTDEHPLLTARVEPATAVQNAEWSPDGAQVAFESLETSPSTTPRASVWTVDADGRNARRVAACDPGACRQFSEPTWSPDGRRLAMIRFDLYPDGECCSSHLEVLDLDSGRRSVLLQRGYPTSGTWEVLYSPSWSPDGQQLVLTIEHFALEAPYPVVGSQLAVVSASGPVDQVPRLLTDPALAGYAPDWHPGGEVIAFSTATPDSFPTDASSAVWTVRPDGSGLRRLTPDGDGPDRYLAPAWSVDGDSLYLTIAYVGTGGSIVGMVPATLPASGGRPTAISDSGRGTDVKPRPRPGASS